MKFGNIAFFLDLVEDMSLEIFEGHKLAYFMVVALVLPCMLLLDSFPLRSESSLVL